MSLPTDDKSRKNLPIFRGPLMYFPDALLAVAAVCKAGNDQHNPGEPLHWARGKSMEQLDTALRHMMDHGLGNELDTDGMYHMAKAAWRCLAELQLTIERRQAATDKAIEPPIGLRHGGPYCQTLAELKAAFAKNEMPAETAAELSIRGGLAADLSPGESDLIGTHEGL